MNLEQIGEQLNKDFKFPYQLIYKSTNIGDTLVIRIATKPENEWSHGIFLNAPGLVAHIFCTSQYERENDKYTFEFNYNRTKVKLMQKSKNITGDEIYQHVKKQLIKIQETL